MLGAVGVGCVVGAVGVTGTRQARWVWQERWVQRRRRVRRAAVAGLQEPPSTASWETLGAMENGAVERAEQDRLSIGGDTVIFGS